MTIKGWRNTLHRTIKSGWNKIKNKNQEHTSNQEQTIKTRKEIKAKRISSLAYKTKTEIV